MSKKTTPAPIIFGPDHAHVDNLAPAAVTAVKQKAPAAPQGADVGGQSDRFLFYRTRQINPCIRHPELRPARLAAIGGQMTGYRQFVSQPGQPFTQFAARRGCACWNRDKSGRQRFLSNPLCVGDFQPERARFEAFDLAARRENLPITTWRNPGSRATGHMRISFTCSWSRTSRLAVNSSAGGLEMRTRRRWALCRPQSPPGLWTLGEGALGPRAPVTAEQIQPAIALELCSWSSR